MSHCYCSDVKKFHDKFGLATPAVFTFVPKDLHEFRLGFFKEEFTEHCTAYAENNLPEAIDALIDLVYITCGAGLLYGIHPDTFVKLAKNLDSDNIYNIDPFECGEYPQLLAQKKVDILISCLAKNINDYDQAYKNFDEKSVKKALSELYVNCLFGAADMGFTEEMWNELWDDVQKCNMAKERVLKAGDSKRGSTWDVRKPVGWTRPQTAEIVTKFLKNAK
jgi:hypothetical protein